MCALDTVEHVHSHSKMHCNALSCRCTSVTGQSGKVRGGDIVRHGHLRLEISKIAFESCKCVMCMHIAYCVFVFAHCVVCVIYFVSCINVQCAPMWNVQDSESYVCNVLSTSAPGLVDFRGGLSLTSWAWVWSDHHLKTGRGEKSNEEIYGCSNDTVQLLSTFFEHFLKCFFKYFLDALASLETTHVSEWVSQSPAISPESQCSSKIKSVRSVRSVKILKRSAISNRFLPVLYCEQRSR